MTRGPVLLFVAALLLPACGPSLETGGVAEPQADGRREAVCPGPVDRWTLFRGLAGAEEVEVLCAAPELLPAVERAIERTRDTVPHALRLVDPTGSAGSAAWYADAPRIAIGLLGEPWMAALAHAAGLADSQAQALRVEGVAFQRPGDVLVATVADPERAGLPLTVYLAHEAGALAAQLEHVTPRWRPGIHVLRDGLSELRVPLLADGRPDWGAQVDRGVLRREAARRGTPGEVEPVLTPGAGLIVRFGRGVDARRAASYAELLADAAREVRGAFGAGGEGPIEVRLAGGVADMLRLYGATGLSRVTATSPPGAVALLAREMPNDGGACAAQATALRALGAPRAAWMLDGVGAAFARTWWGHPLDVWIARLATAGVAPSVAELVAPDAPARTSPHVLVPLRGALFAHLLETAGADAVERWWAGAPLACDTALEKAFAARLAAAAGASADALAAERERRRELALGRGWRGGVNVVPARGDVDGSLAADAVQLSLAAAASAGATSAAFPVMAYLEPRGLELPGDPLPPWPDGEPGDLALAHALIAARAAGLDTMLVPELVATPTGTWSDAGALGDAAESNATFELAARAFVHYGLLAELCGVELLCLGVETPMTSLTTPLPGEHDAPYAQKRAAWSDTIARVRAVFTGALTYAADPRSDRSELSRVAFWPELDYVGATLFQQVMRPTGNSARRASRVRLEEVLAAAAAVAREHDRPLLVVQAGYPSHATAHARPALATGVPDPVQQEELYRVLADAVVAARGRGELAGLFLWRWDPVPTAGGAADPSHTPQRKPAAQELRRMLER
jgi:hypothetical protein